MVYNDYFEWSWSIKKSLFPLFLVLVLAYVVSHIIHYITNDEMIAALKLWFVSIFGGFILLVIITLRRRKNFTKNKICNLKLSLSLK